MSQEKSPRPTEERFLENSKARKTFRAEIKEFRTESKRLMAGESASALIELAKQLTEKFSTLKEKADVSNSAKLALYISLYSSLCRVAKREGLSPMAQSKLKALIGNFLKSNLSFHEQAVTIFHVRNEDERFLAEKQKLDVYRIFGDLRVAVKAQLNPETEATAEDWFEAKIPAGNGRLLPKESKTAISNLGKHPEIEQTFRNMLRDLQKNAPFLFAFLCLK